MAQNNVDISLEAIEAEKTKKALNSIIEKLKDIQDLSKFTLGIDASKIKEAEKGIAKLQETQKQSSQSQTKSAEEVNKVKLQQLDLEKKLLIVQRDGFAQSEQMLKAMIGTNKLGTLNDAERIKTMQKLIEEERNYSKEADLTAQARIKQQNMLLSMSKKEYEAYLINNKIKIDAEKAHHEAILINKKLDESFQKQHYEAIQQNKKIVEQMGKVEYEAYLINNNMKTDAEKVHYEALKMNAKLKEDMQKKEYEAYKMNEAFDAKKKSQIEQMGKVEYEAHLMNNKMETDKQKIIYEAYKQNEKFNQQKKNQDQPPYPQR